MTESSSIRLIVVNGGARALRKRAERSILLPLDDSSASVLTSFLTTVLISVLMIISIKRYPRRLKW
jgi:hypothetical protein